METYDEPKDNETKLEDLVQQPVKDYRFQDNLRFIALINKERILQFKESFKIRSNRQANDY